MCLSLAGNDTVPIAVRRVGAMRSTECRLVLQVQPKIKLCNSVDMQTVASCPS